MARRKQAARKLGGAKADPLAKFANETEERKAFFANRQAARERTKQDKINRKANKARKAANIAANGGGKQSNGNPNKITLPGQDPDQNMNPHAGLTKKQKKALNKASQEQEQQSNLVVPPGLSKKQKKAQARQQEAAREKKEQEQLKQDPMYEPSDSGAQQDHQMKGSGEGDDEYEPPETEEVTKRVTRSQVSTLPRRPAKLRAQDIHTEAGQQEKQEVQVQIQRPFRQFHADTPALLQRELDQAAANPDNASSSNQMQTTHVSGPEQSLRRLNSWQLRNAPPEKTERGRAIHAVQSQGSQTPAAHPVDASSSNPPNNVGDKNTNREAKKKARSDARVVMRAEKRRKKKEQREADKRAQGAASVPSQPPKPRYIQMLAEEEKKIVQDEINGLMVDGKAVSKKALQVAESVRYQELAEKGVVMANFELMKGRTTFPLDFWEDLAGTKMAAMSRGVGMHM